MDRPLRLITANPVDQLARTLEALLVVASAPLSVEELADAAADDVRSGSSSRSASSPTGSARAAAGSCSSTSPAATPSAPPARQPRRARACSSGRSSAASRRRRSRRSRSSPTSARAAGRRSPASAASPPTRPSPACSSAGLIAEAGRDDGAGRRRPLPDDAAVRAGLRARERRRAAAPRRPGRDRRGHPRAAPLGRRRQDAPARSAESTTVTDGQICQEPPRSTGTRSPSRVIPSTSSSFEPIMKSTWMSLLFARAWSASSSSGNVYAFPSAMWLAAFSSSRVS